MIGQEAIQPGHSRQGLRPWEPQSGESASAYEAFVLYRDLGPRRSVVEAARRAGRCCSLFYRWSVRHCWAQRARAWDLAQMREQEQARREAREEVRRACLRRGQQLAELGWARLAMTVGRDPATGLPRFADDFGPREALRACVEGARMQAAACEELPSDGPEAGLTQYLLAYPDATLEQVQRLLEGEPAQKASDSHKEE